MRPVLKRDILFISVTLALVVCVLAGMVFLPKENRVELNERSQSADSSIAQTKDAADSDTSDIKILHGTDMVFISKNGKSFHADKNCAGAAENVSEIACSEAVEMGRTPCGKCLKGYEILN